MKLHHTIFCLLFSHTLACGTTAPPPPAAPTKPIEAPSKPTVKEPALGVEMAVPKGFTKRSAGTTTLIAGPDPALRVAILISKRANLDDAVVAGWKQADPGHTAKPKNVIRPPTARDPYEKSIVANYEIGADQIVRQAIAHLYKGHSIVMLVRGPLPEVKKRSAQLREILGSVKPTAAAAKTLSAADAKQLSMAQLEALRDFVEKARATLEVPGAALAVVQDGNVLLSEGFGHTDLKKKRKVTAKTQMMIGSITKSFTALMLAKLVSEGKLSWEMDVSKLDPDFRLKSKKQTAALKLWHLMCACTGVPRRDMPILFEWEKASPESVMRDMRQLELLTSFGETFQYSNQLVAAAGFLAGKAAGKGRGLARRYRRLLRKKVLDPLGMKDTRIDFAAVARRRKHAMPHSETIEGKVQTLPLAVERFVLPYAPAGALWSSVDDFSKLLVELTQKESKLLPPRAQLEMLWKPRVKVSAKGSYGLGWISGEYKGVTFHAHGGGTLGFISYFAYIPAARAGFVLLTNAMRGGGLQSVVKTKLLAQLFGQKDESAAKLAFIRKLIDKEVARLGKELLPEVPEARAKALVGKYEGGPLGKVRVLKKGKRLLLDTGAFQVGFRPKKTTQKKEMYRIVDPPLTGFDFWVTEDEKGRPELNFEPNSTRYTLRRL